MLTPNGGVFGRNPRFNNVTVDGTLTIPRGTTAQRPASPTAGMTRFNTDTGLLEYYSGTAWYGVQREPLEVEYLIVGGGGGGGAGNGDASGGGGAGGFRTNVGATALFVERGVGYSVVVGAGGAQTAGGVNGRGFSGTDSTFFGIASSGGGGGGGFNLFGLDGGSGGGMGRTSAAGFGNRPAVTPSQGNNGGTWVTIASTQQAAGGGGGAGAAGSNGVVGTGGGAGGAGSSSSIDGNATDYAGGGGGGYAATSAFTPYDGGAGGAGGGGKGGGTTTSVAGTANTGGGGGGAGWDQAGAVLSPGRAGGSGRVIIRYLGAQKATGGTVSAGTGSAAGYTIHEFTSSGTFTVTS